MPALISKALAKIKTEVLVVPVCKDSDMHEHSGISSIINRIKGLKEFTGERDEELILYKPAEVDATRVMLMGLGAPDRINQETLRVLAGRAVNKCIATSLSEITFLVPVNKKLTIGAASVLEGLMEGAYLANHRFYAYKNIKKQRPLQKIRFSVAPGAVKKFSRLAARVETVCKSTILARNWVNTPSNDKKPAQFARAVVGLAKKENLKTRVLGLKELRQKGFGAMLAVAAGSRSEPRLVVLDYNPKNATDTITLVGKGVTFDSGGLNLKPSKTLHRMKADMAGAAAVAATLVSVSKLRPKVRVVGIMPLVENMLSATATRPGDIIKSYADKTVEIGNTDAEGRLILIDAIAYAVKTYKPQILIDMATLTGACVTALGEKIAGLFTFDDRLAQKIMQSGEKTRERCWRMPLPEDYKDLLKSDLADINNMPSTRAGAAITAALFLSEFTGNTRWAHIDIAGPANSKNDHAYCPSGATGFGVRLLCDFLMAEG
ncbi:MAG: leucyl aminopeptidase [Deltaproteobacteria bacterium]|nr:MAG: leucyl aminopeptidase [Deltaproteobacteria bacterium]